VDNNYLDLGMNKSGFVHTLPSGRLSLDGKFFAKFATFSTLSITSYTKRHMFSVVNVGKKY
jgi:hypothetical protein